MIIKKFDNIFSESELKLLKTLFNTIVIPTKKDGSYIYDTDGISSDCTISSSLGRIQSSFVVPIEINSKIMNIVKDISSDELVVSSMTYVEYNQKYGTPNLPPHFDGDGSDFIINYQLSSNTSWDIGLNLDLYPLNDNSALVFDPNKTIHWRTHKVFKENEYVKMIFFRLKVFKNNLDNSHLRYSLDNPVYKEANELRNSLNK